MDEKLKALEKYNDWSKQRPRQGFLRSFYLEKIAKFIGNSLVKVIVGQRRTGKSYLLRQIAAHLVQEGVPPQNILYVNKEYVEFDDLKEYKDLVQLVNIYKSALKPEGRIYLFIDEIQNIDQWERFVNSYAQDFAESYELFISGSNSKMLSGELSTLLSGRYVDFEVLPFSYKEFVGIRQLDASKQTYIEYLQSGGLPELFSLQDDEAKMRYVSAVKDTVLLRDIIQRHAIKEPKLLEDIFVYLVNTSSLLMSVNNVTHYFKSKGRKTSYDTVANYIGYIEDAFLMHRAERYDIKGKDTIAGNAKYYGNDLAFKNYMFSGFSHGLGHQLENLLYLELRRHGYQVYVGAMPNREVDFVAMKGDRVLYVQSAYLLVDENTIAREYSALEAIDDNHEKVVVSLDDLNLPNKNGIKHVQAWQFQDIL